MSNIDSLLRNGVKEILTEKNPLNLFSSDLSSSLESKLITALEDEDVCNYITGALTYGYENLGIENAREIVSKIFYKLKAKKHKNILNVFKEVKESICSNINGKSSKDIWSEYYRDVESSFISKLLQQHVEGDNILEVGVGRGWVSYNLLKNLPNSVRITQTDLMDYRAKAVKEIKNCKFVNVKVDNPFPFPDNSFDTAIVVYVLHHLDSLETLEKFLCKLSEVVTKKVIILDDTYMSTNRKFKFRLEQTPLLKQFNKMNNWQKECALTFSCFYSNYVDSCTAEIAPPQVFLEFYDLMSRIEKNCNGKIIYSEYLGIPRTKVYLNSEAIFVVRKG